MIWGLFITGTGTNVGKTTVAAAIMQRYRGIARLKYWKPIQTGAGESDDTAEVRRLGACADGEVFPAGMRFSAPLSPHRAARLEGRTIVIGEVVELVPHEACDWIVEGAGGALVPLNDADLMTDLMKRLDLPALVVATSSLGTINHTLLTLEALRARSIAIAGVVMAGEKNSANREAIEHFGGVAVLGEMPHFDSLEPAALGAWARAELDPRGDLARFFSGSRK